MSGSKVFYGKVLDEIHDLICTGRKYSEERKTAAAEFKKGHALAVAYVTELISPHVGSSAAFLSFAVVCIFCTINKVGKNAWCKAQADRREATDQQVGP